MKRISKRLLCLALVLSMLVGVIPAVAATGELEKLTITGDPVVSSTVNNSWAAKQLTDGDTTKGWSSKSGASGAWFYVELSEECVVNEIHLYPRVQNSVVLCFPSAFIFQYSLDGSTWTDIPNTKCRNYTATTDWQVFTLRTPVSAKYIRMNALTHTVDDNGNQYCQLCELELYGSQRAGKCAITAAQDASLDGQMLAKITANGEAVNGTVYVDQGAEVVMNASSNDEWKFVKWTGDVESTENPVTITASADMAMYAVFEYIGEYNVAKGKSVTDTNNGSNSVMWSASNLTDGKYVYTSTVNGWTSGDVVDKDAIEGTSATIDLGADFTINEAHLYPRADALTYEGKPAAFPKDFTVSVSSDGSTWVEVKKVTDAVAPDVGDYLKVEFDKVEARYVKFDFTKTNDMAKDDTLDRVQLCEIGLYNTAATAVEAANNVIKALIPYQSTIAVTSANKAQVQALIDEAKAAAAAYEAAGGNKEDLNMALLDGAEAAMVADALHQTDSYTIDIVSKVVDNAQGFAFHMADTGNFLMWQLSTSKDNVGLTPHVKIGGGWKEYPRTDIGEYMGLSANLEGKTVYEKIVVNGNEMKTYMGFSADSMQLVHTYTYTYESAATLLNIGFRHDGVERASYDSIVIRDANGNLIYSEDFSDPAQVAVTGQRATAYSFTEDGWMNIGVETSINEQVYIIGKASAFDAGVEVAEARINEIGEVTAESRTAVEGAREAYEVLTDAQKAAVSNYDVLTAAEEALTVAKIGDASYYTVEEAVADADADDIVKLVANSDEEITVAADKTLYLDLNGKSLKQVTVEGKFYGMDTTTDDYACGEDDYGKIGTIVGDYEMAYRTDVTGKGKYYVAVAETDGSVSFHRFYVGITHIALRPSEGGAGYTMTLAGDAKVKSVMSDYGYTVYLTDLEGNAIENAEAKCEGTQADFLGGIQKMTALTVTGVLDEKYDDNGQANAENYKICVKAHVTLNGEQFDALTGNIQMTFREIVEATDAVLNVGALSDVQKEALIYMYNELGVKDMNWNVDNIKALAKAAENAE